ncbi:VOC family protein [Thalassospira sp. TSL5-1]|uniref:VOC family protein n=1 Tax=Thalassospira sp. TSL5-1 TaxID=1544451 RepID=UPI00208E4487|nr:VOC family protein [Thalassospira sp. TSL5-1]
MTDMIRAIDHLVLCVQDLDTACDRYRKLGFRVTPKAVHPFGTGNALVQLDGMYLELLAVLDPELIGPDELDQPFSFAVYNRNFLRLREGMSMLALQSQDARADRAAFLQAGAAVPEVFDFARKGETPDGKQVDLAFSLSFASHPLLRHGVCFSCQHHHPAENFYFSEYQSHPNSAVAIDQVFLTHWAAEAVEEFFSSMALNDLVDVGHQDELLARYPVGDSILPDDGFAGFRLRVKDIEAIRPAALSLGAVECGDMLVVPPTHMFGVMMVITQQKAA